MSSKNCNEDARYVRLRADLKETLKRINYTFLSILFFNYVLIVIGVVMFGAALYSALWLQRFDLTTVLSITGFGDIFTVFKFSMDRVQRSLGDQVQVETAKCGLINQMNFVRELESKSNVTIDDIEKINEEIRRATSYTMELIQKFTKIAERAPAA